MNRTALGLVNGIVYLGYASHGDNGPYHGWLLGYNATNVNQLVCYYNSTPNGGLGGFWQGGGGPAVDSAGNLYLITGNGSFNANAGTISTNNNYGMSFLKFSTTNGAAQLVDFFSPHDEASQSGGDLDLGSGAPIVLPDSAGSAAHRHLVVGAGKNGTIYLLDRDSMGRFNAANDNQIVQVMGGAVGGNFGTPAFWNNRLYFIGGGDNLKAFTVTNGVIASNPVRSPNSFGGDKSSTTPIVSSDGTNNGIVWAIHSSAFASSGPAILYAYNATNVAQQLYSSSSLLSRDNPGPAVKFTRANRCQWKSLRRSAIQIVGFWNRPFHLRSDDFTCWRSLYQFGNDYISGCDGGDDDLLHVGWHRAHNQFTALHQPFVLTNTAAVQAHCRQARHC
ncbi:MAG: hypothetical protein WDM76_13495 [Limisphaerales bacterium]